MMRTGTHLVKFSVVAILLALVFMLPGPINGLMNEGAPSPGPALQVPAPEAVPVPSMAPAMGKTVGDMLSDAPWYAQFEGIMVFGAVALILTGLRRRISRRVRIM